MSNSKMAARTIQPVPADEPPARSGSFPSARRMWLRMLLFLAPILAFTALPIVLVDPYNIFSQHSLVASWEVKRYFGVPINSVLWKLPQFDRAPKNNILLGDSEMYRVREEDIEAIDKGNAYFNFSYGGGTLAEGMATFRHAASLTKLQSVYFQISFLSYSPDQRNRVKEAEKMLHNRAEYLGNPDALQASYYELLSLLPGGRIKMEPTKDEKFWNDQLAILGKRYRNMVYPAAEKNELQKIADDCLRNHIRLYFLIAPQSIDAQRLVEDAGATDKYERFKADLSSMAPTIDCDIASPLTTVRGNYSDPVHMQDQTTTVMVDDIWGGKFKQCRKLGRW